MNLSNYNYIFITDIGSTTTKGLLLARNGNDFSFFHQADASTTVEKPYEDVNIGVLRVVKQLEELSHIDIYKDDKFVIPYITTSSAAGGLQIMVIGLTKHDTAKNAEITALGAGGVILRTFAVNDGLRDIEKINIINNLDPDMVLFAGGYDNKSSFYNIFSLSNILSLADIKSRFKQENKVPLLYCGNNYAKDYVKSFLSKDLLVSVTENIRPSLDVYNYTPAKQKINKIFKDDVMKRAPGFQTLSEKVYDEVVVTPTAVEKMIEIYSKDKKGNIIVVDMGGATTDIYSYIKGKYHRTVAANIGLSFSLGNIFATILESESLDYIMEYIPKGIDSQFVKNYIYNKTITPSYIPQTKTEKLIEKIIAALGINLAMQQHLDTNFDIRAFSSESKTLVENLNRVLIGTSNFLTGKNYKEKFYGFIDNDGFYYSDIDQIIGSGGAISFADNEYEQIQLLIEGFMPAGVTTLSVDSPFKISHLGLFAYYDEINALKMFKEDCVKDLALVIAPIGKIKQNKRSIIVENLKTNETTYLNGGSVTYLEETGRYRIKAIGNLKIDKNKTEIEIQSKIPIVFDLRGRDLNFNGISLEKSDCSFFKNNIISQESKIIQPICNYEKGSFNFERKLPHKGIIRVKEQDKVDVNEIFGETKYRLSKYSFIDLKRFLVDTKDFSKDLLIKNILVKVGDEIKENQDIYNGFRQKEVVLDASNSKTKTVTKPFIFKSPVDGIVEYIDFENGMLKVAEKLFAEDQFIEVEFADILKIKPKNIKSYLDFKLNDMVLKKQILGKKTQFGLHSKFFRCKAPISGIIKGIDTNKGTITIVNESIKDVFFETIYSGEITKVKEQSVTITSNGIKISGVMGYGSESYGTLSKIGNLKNISDIKDLILYSDRRINYQDLQELLKLPLKGLILPSIEANDISKIIGKEIGVAITGDEDLKFPIVILHGFGDIDLNNEASNILAKNEGEIVSLNGRTHVRAGILRPFVMLYS